MRNNLRLALISLSVSLALAACGGGGSGGSTAPASDQSGNSNTGGTNNGGSNPPPGDTGGSGSTPADTSMLMSCPDTPDAGLTEQCSGSEVIVTAANGNGVAATNSGVQVYAKSTVDLPDKAQGLALATGGLAEVRLFKNADNTVSKPALLLSNLGIKWNGVDERPKIIETFLQTMGRVTQGTVNGKNDVLIFSGLPLASDTAFFDGKTPEHYANNRYFPRAEPAQNCPYIGAAVDDCARETKGIGVTLGDWRSTGTNPDETGAIRLHEDGDVLGRSVPYAGNKGYREFANYSYRYANMTKWLSQDTVEIAEWMNKTPSTEHNQNRRGVVAFGDVTDPSKMPTAGTATYKGWARGWYASSSNDPDPVPFQAEVTVTAHFDTRKVDVVATNGSDVSKPTATALAAANFSATVDMGAANTKLASYLTGALTSGNLKGGIGGRYFGPAATSGTTPPEVGASFSMTDAATGATVIGGFIAIKR